MQGLPDGAVVAVLGVGHHRRDGKTGRADLPPERQRQAPLFLKEGGGRYPRRATPGVVGDPVLRQIQRRPQRPRAAAGPQRRRHRHLAGGHLAQRAAVLPRHADRVRTLFREARLVEDQDALALRQDRPQPFPQPLGVPRRVGDEVLKGLIGRRLRDPRQHRRHRFAGAVAEQPIDVLAKRDALSPVPKAVLKLIEPTGQPSQEGPRALIEHCATA